MAHNYFEIDLDIVWIVVSDKLPTLETAVQNLLSKIDET
ncbi:MAG: HepT-like ribonuclease domain-containing protein [Pseudanabaena sp.]